jgi:phage terminase small subunit
MPMGGYRPNGGRPKGSKTLKSAIAGSAAVAPVVAPPAFGDATAKAATEAGITPVQYMLSIVNDSNADPALRARMAIAAAPFVHQRTSEGGKKEAKAEAAKVASTGRFAAAPAPKLRAIK